MPSLPAQGNLARHGLLVVAIAAALGLLATAWSSRRGAGALADTVNQGQAEALLRDLRERAPPHRGPPKREVMDRFVEEHRFEGLRGVGMAERDGTVRTLAGTLTSTTIPADLGPGPHVRRAGDLVRVYSPPPGEAGQGRPPPRRDGPPPGMDAPPPGIDGPPPGMDGPPGPPPPDDGPPPDRERPLRNPPPDQGPTRDEIPEERPRFDAPPPIGASSRSERDTQMAPSATPPPRGPGRTVLEFEPRLANSLIDRANRAFAIAAFAAAILVTAAALLWRRAVREAALGARLAQSERLASLGTMSAVLAHEIKNPLASLKGNAQLVAEALDEGSRPRAQADRVVEAAVRLQTLVANLLDFARGGPIARAPVDPAELVFLAACEAAPRATLALDGAPPTFSLDAVRMGQVIENVLRNAEQASPDRVAAEVRLENERLAIIVRDEGPGFTGAPEGFFEPFATTKARGTGLGLAVARRIVELHGGTITARNRPEGGAEVRIEIPPS